MIHVNMHIFNKPLNVSLRVCAINTRDSLAAVADMTWAKESANARKPKIYKFDDLYKLAEQNGYEVEDYKLPVEMGYSEDRLIREKKQHWIKKRDARFEVVESLVSTTNIELYLFGDGIGIQIRELIVSV